ncbi:unnamed protein product [Trichobilharzia szidati]|nr:unnamed protein product [Trichobilharzia szidati]
MARHTSNLFETNQHTAIVILGSEEMDNFFIQPQNYLHSTGINNHSYERLLPNHQDLRRTTDTMANFIHPTSDLDDDGDVAANHHAKNNVDTGTYYYNRNSNMYAKAIQVNNKRLFQSTTYRVALRACSQYSDGRQLCSTSQWSERISSILSENVNRLSNLKPIKDKTLTWNLQESSSFTIILIGLAGGLIFFAILSTILGCILRRRKQQLARRSALESSNQWDAQICRDLSKSIFAAENLSGSHSSQTKCFASKNNNNSFINSHPSNYFLNIRTEEGSRSPSNSSSGILGLNLPRPSTGGLSVGTNIMSPLASSTNQLTISDISPVITRSVHMNSVNNSLGEKCESPTRSVNSTTAEAIVMNRPLFNIQSKSGTTSMMENFNQLFRDGTIEIHRMPIPVDQLQEIIYQARSNNYINFQQEFQAIEQISKSRYISAVHSNLDMNKSKNRYPNILAYDRTRVTIQSSNHMNISGSDYINANYIDGYRKQNAFIATQAPLPNTFEDFWTMIWEQNTSVIVMLSKIIEKGQVKCDQYWPTVSGTLIFSNLIITHIETTELANYTIRSFELRKESEHRKIWHLQYTSWPDHGVPIYSTVFLMFLRRVGTITPADCGPIVVHCSSGTGRTGIYIAINILLERMKSESVIDIFGLVNQLRMQRNSMIETQDEYTFIYTALLESITDGNTEVSARNLYIHLQHLSMIQTTVTNDYPMNPTGQQLSSSSPPTISVNSVNENVNNTANVTATTNSLGYTGFQLEFRKINKLSPNIAFALNCVTPKTGILGYSSSAIHIQDCKSVVSCEVAKRNVNFSKNRLVSIIPFDWNRVTLCPVRGVDGSDYINASLIDGYLKKNAYIACQGPMVSTVEDFWRMLWEKHSCLIVMLCSIKESGKEKCFTYWPEDKLARYQFFVVDLTAQYTMSSHILREFKVTDARDGESRIIRQLQYIQWNEQGLPQTSESIIDLIGHMHKIKEQQNYDGPITVHCSSGAGRTGLFITMCNVLERLRQESVIDMYQTVKLLRQQRVWMVQTEEQYRFCYTATLDYLNSFDLCTQPQLQAPIPIIPTPLPMQMHNLHRNSPNLKTKLKSTQLSDKSVLFEFDKNYEIGNNHNHNNLIIQ